MSKGKVEILVVIEVPGSVFQQGGEDRCAPNNIEELVWEVERQINAEPCNTFGGGQTSVRIATPEDITRIFTKLKS